MKKRNKKLLQMASVPSERLDLVRRIAVQDGMIKTARLDARITPELHHLLKRAAELEGRTVTDFVMTAAQAAAEQRIERTHLIQLSLQDQQAFAESILHPPDPSPALRRAFRRHRDLIQITR